MQLSHPQAAMQAVAHCGAKRRPGFGTLLETTAAPPVSDTWLFGEPFERIDNGLTEIRRVSKLKWVGRLRCRQHDMLCVVKPSPTHCHTQYTLSRQRSVACSADVGKSLPLVYVCTQCFRVGTALDVRTVSYISFRLGDFRQFLKVSKRCRDR